VGTGPAGGTPGLGGGSGSPAIVRQEPLAAVQVNPSDPQSKVLGEEETEAYVQYRVRRATYEGSHPHPAVLGESAILGGGESPEITTAVNLPGKLSAPVT
jgi:hypothetical protein